MSHIRNRVGLGGLAAQVEMSADVGSLRAVESLSYLSLLTSRALLALVGVSGLGELHLPLHPVPPVFLSVSKCVLCMGIAVLLEEGP